MEKIKKIVLYFFNSIFYWISKLIPKNKNIWIFGAWFGDKYADNSKYLFEYVNKYHPEIKVIWGTNNEQVIDELKAKKYLVYRKYSLNSILYALRAKYSIFVHSNLVDCLPFLNNGKTKLIQLWHGIPIKKIGFDDQRYKISNTKKILKSLFLPFLNENYDLIVSSSEEDNKNMLTAFNASHNQMCCVGLQRNDVLVSGKNELTDEIKTITYLPTFRDSIGDKIDLFTEYSFDIQLWEKKLSDLGIKLFIKMHPVNKPSDNLLQSMSCCKNIEFLDEIDAAEILPKTDILITDYSSVFLDYLLTDKPIIFAPFDYEKYLRKDRELYYDYDAIIPGPKCNNWNEVLEWVIKFQTMPQLYKLERKKIKDLFHKYQDGKSCDRVFNSIVRL